MKRSLVVASLVTASIAAGCGVATTKSPSRFITTFSPEDAINRAYSQPDGKKPLVSNSGSSEGTGGLGHRLISADVLLNETEEPQFLARMKTEVSEQLRKYGAKTTGEGSGTNDSYLEYSEGAIAGVVQISGMRGASDAYRVILLIAER